MESKYVKRKENRCGEEKRKETRRMLMYLYLMQSHGWSHWSYDIHSTCSLLMFFIVRMKQVEHMPIRSTISICSY